MVKGYLAEMAKRRMNVRIRLYALVLVAALTAATVACSGNSAPSAPAGIVLVDPVAEPSATPEAVVTSFEGKVQEFEVNLASNGSPQLGTAVFTRKNDYANVAIRLRPGVAAQSVTLRRGTCPNPEGFLRTLNLAVGGVMRQEMRDMPFEDLLKGNMTLVVNTDDESFNEFAACADLPKVE